MDSKKYADGLLESLLNEAEEQNYDPSKVFKVFSKSYDAHKIHYGSFKYLIQEDQDKYHAMMKGRYTYCYNITMQHIMRDLKVD